MDGLSSHTHNIYIVDDKKRKNNFARKKSLFKVYSFKNLTPFVSIILVFNVIMYILYIT